MAILPLPKDWNKLLRWIIQNFQVNFRTPITQLQILEWLNEFFESKQLDHICLPKAQTVLITLGKVNVKKQFEALVDFLVIIAFIEKMVANNKIWSFDEFFEHQIDTYISIQSSLEEVIWPTQPPSPTPTPLSRLSPFGKYYGPKIPPKANSQKGSQHDEQAPPSYQSTPPGIIKLKVEYKPPS